MDRIEKYTEEQRFEFGDERPHPTPGVMQVIYKDNSVYAVDFICPCGCGHSCFTPVVGEHHRRNHPEGLHAWDYFPGPRLSPSIRWLSGCKAHFNIEEGGRVLFHGDSGNG